MASTPSTETRISPPRPPYPYREEAQKQPSAYGSPSTPATIPKATPFEMQQALKSPPLSQYHQRVLSVYPDLRSASIGSHPTSEVLEALFHKDHQPPLRFILWSDLTRSLWFEQLSPNEKADMESKYLPRTTNIKPPTPQPPSNASSEASTAAEASSRPVLKMKRTGGAPGGPIKLPTTSATKTSSTPASDLSTAPGKFSFGDSLRPSMNQDAQGTRYGSSRYPEPEPARIQSDIRPEPASGGSLLGAPSTLNSHYRPPNVLRGGPASTGKTTAQARVGDHALAEPGLERNVTNGAEVLRPPVSTATPTLTVDTASKRQREASLGGSNESKDSTDGEPSQKRARADALGDASWPSSASSSFPGFEALRTQVDDRGTREPAIAIASSVNSDDSDIAYESAPESGFPSYLSDEGDPDAEDETISLDEGTSLRPVTNAGDRILLTEDGRPYNQWRDERGRPAGTDGALLPAGYQPLADQPETPWVCPVRSCRGLFSTVTGLGHHFSRGHYGTLLNDNKDGTLSAIGTWDSGGSSTGPKIISRQTPDPENSEPMAQPHTTPTRPKLGSGQHRVSTAKLRLPRNPEPEQHQTTSSRAKLKSHGVFIEIELTPSSKPYNMVRENGKLISSRGFIVPDNYELSDYPGNPWICPVRSCRRVFKNSNALGSHFPKKHRGCLLNDNGDGTLSLLAGKAQLNRAIVVSQTRRKPDELEPLATPRLGGYIPVDDTSAMDMSNAEKTSPLPAPPDMPAGPSGGTAEALSGVRYQDLPKPIESNPQRMWSYVAPFLKRTDKKDIPITGHVPEFLELPRVRDIRWNTPWIAKNPFLDTQPRDISSFIMQVTGEFASEPCTKCAEGKGPYQGCVIISHEAPMAMQAVVISCANCYYHNGQTYCSHQTFLKARFESLFPGATYDAAKRHVMQAAARMVALSPRLSDTGSGAYSRRQRNHVPTYNLAKLSDKAKKGSEGTDGESEPARRASFDDAQTLSRRSERLAVLESAAEAEQQPGRRLLTVRLSSASLAGTASPALHPGQAASRTTSVGPEATGRSPVDATTSPVLISAGPAQPLSANLLEMEEWEIAPGRVRNNPPAGPPENIAFSNAYLTSNREVPIDHNFSFRVEIVRSGGKFDFEPDAKSTRVCSLASGKLKVRIDDVEFAIGPNGVFRINPGASCSVENRLYIEAYIYICVHHFR